MNSRGPCEGLEVVDQIRGCPDFLGDEMKMSGDAWASVSN